MQFNGYRRKDGKVGIRNHVAIVSTVLCSSTVTRKIIDATGAMPVTHEAGCGQLGLEKEYTERVLRGVVTHPNVGAILVVGLGCEQIDAEMLTQAATGKPARYVNIQKVGGTTAAIEIGTEAVREMLEEVAQDGREPSDVSELILATQCGSSDTGSGLASNPAVGALADILVAAGATVLMGETGGLYGAAGALKQRAVSPEVGQRIIEITDVIERYYKRMEKVSRRPIPHRATSPGG